MAEINIEKIKLQTCNKCGEKYPFTNDYFYKNLNSLRKVCIVCDKKRAIEYRSKHKNQILEYSKKYFKLNKEAVKEYQKNNKEKIKINTQKWQHNNKEYFKKYREKNEEKIKAYSLKYSKENKEKIKEYNEKNIEKIRENKRRYQEKNKTNINYIIKKRLRERVRVLLKKQSRNKHTIELLGCDIDIFKTYFKNKFINGMTWDKFMNGEIHIDHIIPCCKFNLINENQQNQCFHYRNLQPLWAKDNLSKGGELIESKAQLNLVI